MKTCLAVELFSSSNSETPVATARKGSFSCLAVTMRSIRKAAAEILKGEDLEFIGTPSKTDLPQGRNVSPATS